MGFSAAAVAAASIGGAVISSQGAQSAANTQASSANNASQVQLQMFNQLQQNLQPYMNTGNAANNYLLNALGIGSNGTGTGSSLLTGPTMNEATLEQTPGYQFNLSQGLKSVQNSAAARGLGVSGAALKGASTYATGLADSTYQNQYNNAVTNQTNEFNRLMGLTQIGQNSAAGVGSAGIQTGSNIGNNLISAGNASAAGTIASANAYGSGLSGLSSASLLYGLSNMYGSNTGVDQSTGQGFNALINSEASAYPGS
jgi:hypothetical protein